LRAQKKVTKEKGAPVRRRYLENSCGSLRCSPRRAAAQLAQNAQTVLADNPRLGCDCSAALRGPKDNGNFKRSQFLLDRQHGANATRGRSVTTLDISEKIIHNVNVVNIK